METVCPQAVLRLIAGGDELLRHRPIRALGAVENFTDGRGKVFHAGARHNDGVAPAVGFLGDAQEFPTIVLPELDVEMLPLDLQLPRLDDVIHFLQTVQSMGVKGQNGRTFYRNRATSTALCVKS